MQRSFTNPFEVIDRTRAILEVPNQHGLINQLNIFGETSIAQNTFSVEKVKEVNGYVLDRVRGERNNVGRNGTREIHAFNTVHFPADDYLTPQDVSGVRAYGREGVDTAEEAVARKLATLARFHFNTLEMARAQALVSGTVFAPGGTSNTNWLTSFGVTRTVIDFDFDNTAANPILKAEDAIDDIQDKLLTGVAPTGFVALCSREFFDALITHARVEAAYLNYKGVVEPLKNRLVSSLGPHIREFEHGGIRYIEYRGVDPQGNKLIPTGDAYIIPTGLTDIFETIYSPADDFAAINTLGEKMYAKQFYDEKERKIQIQTETNFINMLRLPQAVVRAHV
jgi:hypothetical protein